ncbi:MAG: MBL fold metallo-hydrolase [Xanthomonadales bacterium]|nr:MBL fold metallo-hydrolase [Xanthomonadales bacterium]
MNILLHALVLATLTLSPTAHSAKADEVALPTSKGPLTLHIIHHASFVLHWNHKTIVVDPTGSGDLYQGQGAPDLILITHAHGDHFSSKTLAALDTTKATLVMPASVADKLDKPVSKHQLVMANGETAEREGISIQAVPMYNLTAARMKYHPKGWGNGYVLTLGGKRVYISGDSEGTPEMRALKHIDLAFVCMNLPYTMDVAHAAAAVLAFKPAIVYPYHYRGQDTAQFKRLVQAKDPHIDVRLRDWYAQ